MDTLTSTQAAARLGVSRWTARRMIHDGRLPRAAVGGRDLHTYAAAVEQLASVSTPDNAERPDPEGRAVRSDREDPLP